MCHLASLESFSFLLSLSLLLLLVVLHRGLCRWTPRRRPLTFGSTSCKKELKSTHFKLNSCKDWLFSLLFALFNVSLIWSLWHIRSKLARFFREFDVREWRAGRVAQGRQACHHALLSCARSCPSEQASTSGHGRQGRATSASRAFATFGDHLNNG